MKDPDYDRQFSTLLSIKGHPAMAAVNEADPTQHAGGPLVYCGSEPGAIGHVESDTEYRERIIAQLKANGDAVLPEDHTAIGHQLDFLGLGIGLQRREAALQSPMPTWTDDAEAPTHVDHTTIACPACKASWLGAEIPPAHRDRKRPWIANHTRAIRVYARDPKLPDMMKCPDCDLSFPTP